MSTSDTLFMQQLKKYVKGECFICEEKCKGLVHEHCAVSYYDNKEKRRKEAWDEVERIESKK